jgi:rubrerythrin
VTSAQQALDVALQFEKDSVAFFVGMKEILPDPSGKVEIDQLIHAEMDHIRMISTAKKELSATGVATIS